MKKIITTTLFACMSICYAPYLFGQVDSARERTENNDDGDIPNGGKVVKQKIAFGMEIGLNLANQNWGKNVGSLLDSASNGAVTNVSNNKTLVGARLGCIIDIPFTNNLYLQPGIFYAMNGTKISATANGQDANGNPASVNENVAFHVNTIEVPVNVLYKFGVPGTGRFFIGAGPFVGYNFGGHIKASGSANGNTASANEKLHFGNDANNDAEKNIDYGVGVNLGYEMANGLLFRLRYQLGLANLAVESSGAGNLSSIKSSSFGVNVGYLFGKQAKQKTHQRAKPNGWE